MYEQIRANRAKSIGLLGLLAIILVTLGYFIGGAFGVGGHPGVAIAAVIWIVLCLVSYFAGDSILLGMSGARRIEKKDHPRLFNVVEEMSIASGTPMPKVYIIDDQGMNAFATGRKPETASVAITSGLLARLNRDELQGVMAHEMSHVKNRDILFMTIAGVTVGAVVLIADAYLRHVFWFGGRSRRHGRSRSGGGGAQALLMVIALVLAILAPILAQLLYLACSRRREYLADASAAEMTRYPEGLAAALQKISGPRGKVEGANRATAPMYIVNPLAAKGSSGSVWSTHPPTGERINILRSMVHGASVKDYHNAWQAVTGSAAVPASARASADPVAIRGSGKEEKSPRERAREAVDIIRRIEGFALLTCACGLKLKIPPGYKRDRVKCPNCKEFIALAAATGALPGAIPGAGS
jgi:heat shock protein HtpX